MPQFKDTQGREWSVVVDVSTVKRVRSVANVNLLDVLGGKLIDRLIADPVVLCDTLYAVCKPQADERGVSDEDFGRGLAGDAIEEATSALLEAITDFSPNPRDRAALRGVIAKVNDAMTKARDLVQERIEGGEVDRAIAGAMAQAGLTPTPLGRSSGGAPASPASILTPSRSASSSASPKRRKRASGAGSRTCSP